MKKSPMGNIPPPPFASGAGIDILHGIHGAKEARGAAVIIDVFRAFTLAPCAFSRGATDVIPVAEIAAARRWKAAHPDGVLVAERGGKPVPGADFGNSPWDILAADLTGRAVIHATSAGTRGLMGATGADIVLTGAFVNAGAIVRFLHRRNPKQISLVAMGSAGRRPSPEDTACAEYIRDRLRGREPDFSAIADALRNSPEGRKFGDPSRPWFPAGDLDVCLDLDRFSRVFLLKTGKDGPRLRPAD